MKTKKIIIANWKMNPATDKEVQKIFLGIKTIASKLSNVQTIICPPLIYLTDLVKKNKSTKISFGAQDVFFENKGSFTGMISPEMLLKNKIGYVIIGHSERRNLGEADEIVNKKVSVALNTGLKVILCVGEDKRDENGHFLENLRVQILKSLNGINKNLFSNLVIAYEPLWAISSNKGHVISSNEVYEMFVFIKKVLINKYGSDIQIPKILYGGSVSPNNAEDLIKNGGIDGLLVGKDSLDYKKFGEILKMANM